MTDRTEKWIVPPDRLEALADEAPATNKASAKSSHTPDADPTRNGTAKSRLLVDQWLESRGVAYRLKSEPDAKGRRIYVLKECPFDPSHGDPDACVMQALDLKRNASGCHTRCGPRCRGASDHCDRSVYTRKRHDAPGYGCLS